MRDVSKVFQGILMTKPQHIPDTDTFAKLWLHECSRVFADRLCTQEDREFYQTLVCDLLGQKFKVKWNEVTEIFGY
jgi:dynein heavy chain